MAVAVTEFDSETSVEECIARLEEKVDHIQSDMTDMKADIRRIDAKIDQKIDGLEAKVDQKITGLDAKIAGLDAKIDQKIEGVEAKVERAIGKIDTVKDSVAALRVEMKDSFAALDRGRLLDKVWWLLICGAMLGVMARGLKWI